MKGAHEGCNPRIAGLEQTEKEDEGCNPCSPEEWLLK